MEASAEEAIALLNNWKSTSAFIHVALAAPPVRFEFTGRVVDVSTETVRLAGDSECEAFLGLRGVRFNFADDREALPLKGRRVDVVLMAMLPTGNILTISKIKTEQG